MATKPESQFIRSVHTHLPSEVYRMKNHNAYVAGVPDVWYSANPYDLWIEYKYLPISKPSSWVVPNLSRQQLRWIAERIKDGRPIWTIVGCKPGGVIYYELAEMTAGLPPEQFIQRLQSRKELALQIYNHCIGAEPCSNLPNTSNN